MGVLWYFMNIIKIIYSKLFIISSYIGVKLNSILLLAKKAYQISYYDNLLIVVKIAVFHDEPILARYIEV